MRFSYSFAFLFTACTLAALAPTVLSAATPQRVASGAEGAPAAGSPVSSALPVSSAGPRKLVPFAIKAARDEAKDEARADSAALAAKLGASMKERRKYGWGVVAKMFEPVEVKSTSFTGKLPVWHTWYEEEDFREVYGAMLASKPRGQAPHTMGDAADVDVQNALRKHALKNLDRSISSANLGKTLHQFTRLKGLGVNSEVAPGTGTVHYNPSMIEHLLRNANRISACDPNDFPAGKAPSDLTAKAKPRDANNTWGLCLKHEFPQDGVMIKSAWTKLSDKLPAYGTSAADLNKMWHASKVGAFKSSGDLKAKANTMYTLTDENGVVWGMVGMHISTKDTVLWTWITLWWSKASVKDDDFGADRPSSVSAQWPALANYKMCVVSDFLEKDKHPGDHYRDSKTKTLGAAFDKLGKLSDGAQWCANPYLETKFAKTNCIGCHQGAGVNLDLAAVKQNRKNGIADFVFGFEGIKTAIESENTRTK